jgi:hypothetical protein
MIVIKNNMEILKTRHHIIPSSRGGTNREWNIILLKDKVHQSFHNIFANDLPHEQIIRLTTQFNYNALREEFVDEILNICDEPMKHIYKKIFFKRF